MLYLSVCSCLIIIWCQKWDEHDANLKRVLDRAKDIQLKLNPLKCRFRVPEVTYVGHVVTSDGLRPDPLKTAAINEMPVPTDVVSLH